MYMDLFIYLYLRIYTYVLLMKASLNKNEQPFVADCLIIKKRGNFIFIL